MKIASICSDKVNMVSKGRKMAEKKYTWCIQ